MLRHISPSQPQISSGHTRRAWVLGQKHRITQHCSHFQLCSAEVLGNWEWPWEPQVHRYLRVTPKCTLTEWIGRLRHPYYLSDIFFFSQEAQRVARVCVKHTESTMPCISQFLFGIVYLWNATGRFLKLTPWIMTQDRVTWESSQGKKIYVNSLIER